ncbi:Sister chromatid cohesion protein PDS5 B [Araneus ventricosus]|uniref:Sister chromatid cohesion protein PDS5 B n=1 Tax=Araneus ventricosus TaxID=182803 RepID=A0A4Y2G8E7_ARAVE|nr:Sister chromatid cohesion protein PDS5 B [Araneus ventricosus]
MGDWQKENLIKPRKSVEHVSRFCKDLENNIRLRSVMSLLLNGNISCSEAENKVKEVLKFVDKEYAAGVYYNTIKLLVERIVPVLLDKESVKYLVSMAKNSIIDDGEIEAELKLENSDAKGIDLINALANTYPHYFVDEELFSNLVQILDARQDDVEISEITLETLSYISKNLEHIYPKVYSELLPILQKFIRVGTPKQAKYAVYTVHKMVNDKETVFGEIIESLQDHFTMNSQYFRTALVSIGHIAYLCHDMFASQFKYIVAQTVVRDMLMKDHDLPRGGEELWGPFESLPEETKIKIEGMKVMVRWLTGLKDMVQPAASTFKLLNAVLENNGDLMQKNVPGPKENSWMRLSAASCFLKLCREPNYTECLAIEFFLNLAYVINDPCPEVREHFAAKVNKGLYFMKLPLEFIAILAVGALDARKEFRSNIKQYLIQNISKRRYYVKENSISSDELPHQWPDYALPIVVYLFAHAPFFKVYNDLDSLNKIKECLQLFIETLLLKNENYSFAFFKRLLENIKQTKDKLEPYNESRNLKLYAVCDLALNILMSRPNFVLNDFPGQPKLNSKFFTEPDKSYSNMVTYLPPQLLNTSNLVKSGFDIEVYDKTKKNASKNISKAPTSQEESLPSTSHEEIIPSTSDVHPIPSTSKAPVPSKSKTKVVTASTNSNSSVSQSKGKTNTPKHSSDASPSSTGSCETKQSEISNHSGTNSQIPSISDVASENQKQSETSNSSSSVANLNNGDINHSDSISNQSSTEMDKDLSSVENSKMNCKSKNMSVSKKKHLLKRAVVNRKSTRSSLKDDAPSPLCSEYSKQNGVLPSSPSTTSVDSLYPSDYENVIKPCFVVLRRLEDSPSENLNGNQNGSVSFKRKHNSIDSEDYSSNQGSSAGSHLSEESPRKRGRPPKKDGKTNQELSTLPTNKRKFTSTSTNSVQSLRSSSRTAVNSSLKSSPAKSVVKNGRLLKEKKSPVKSKVNNSHSSNSKKINSIALREELTAEINEIYNVQKTSTKTVKSKQANGQQNKKTNGRTTGRRR